MHGVGTGAMLRLAAEVGVGDNSERRVEQKVKEPFKLMPPRHYGNNVAAGKNMARPCVCQNQRRSYGVRSEFRVPQVQRRFNAPHAQR